VRASFDEPTDEKDNLSFDEVNPEFRPAEKIFFGPRGALAGDPGPPPMLRSR